MYQPNEIKWTCLALGISFVTVYILPSHYLDSLGIPLASFMLGSFLLMGTFTLIVKNTRMSIFEWIYLFLITACCIYQRSVNPIILLTPIIVARFFTEKKYFQIIHFLLKSKIVDLALIFTLLYSFLYGPATGRFLHTGVVEVNTSGLNVLLLGLIYFKRNKFIGYMVLIFGCLSLSRSYFLGLLILLIFGIFKGTAAHPFFKSKPQKSRFFLIMLLAGVLLYFLGILAQQKYAVHDIIYETTFLGRITNFFDISNYFRFTVNVILINVFTEKIIYWFVGCKFSEFVLICHEYARNNGFLYRGNNPHNFLFSYIKLFGIAGLIDLYLVSKQLDRVYCKSNRGIYFTLVSYAVFLSMGFNGEWLFLSFSVLLLYSPYSEIYLSGHKQGLSHES